MDLKNKQDRFYQKQVLKEIINQHSEKIQFQVDSLIKNKLNELLQILLPINQCQKAVIDNNNDNHYEDLIDSSKTIKLLPINTIK